MKVGIKRALQAGAAVALCTYTIVALAVNLTGSTWAELTFHISTGDLTATGPGADNWEGAFGTAAGRWNSVVPFTVTTDTSAQTQSCAFGDPNTTFFSTTRCGNLWPQNVVGVSQTFASSHNNEAIKTAVVFNSNETWEITNGTPTPGNVDFTRVAVHEIGHSIGMGHTHISSAIMAPASSSTTLPQADDKSGVNVLYGSAGLVDLTDLNANGVREIAGLRGRMDFSRGRVRVRDASTKAVLGVINFIDGLRPRTLLKLDDQNGNNSDDLALIQTNNTNGNTVAEIRDSSTGALLKRVFFVSGQDAKYAVVLDDINGNGAQEIVVVHVRDSDNRVLARVRDAATGALLSTLTYATNTWPLDAIIIPDTNSNNFDDVAVLLVNRSTLKLQVQVRDSSTGALLNNFTLPNGFTGHNLARVGHFIGSSSDEIAVLVTRDSDDAVFVRVHEGKTGALLRTLRYKPATTLIAPRALAVFSDNSGNNIDEIGVLLQRDSDGRAVMQIKDASTKANTREFSLPVNYVAEFVTPITPLAGNSEEAAILGFTPAFVSQGRLVDSDSGSQIIKMAFPLP